MYALGVLLLDGVVCIHVLLCLIHRDRKLPHEAKSGTRLGIVENKPLTKTV